MKLACHLASPRQLNVSNMRTTTTVICVDWDEPRAVRLRDEMDREMRVRYAGRHDDDLDFPAKAAVAFAVNAADVVAVILAVDDAGEPLAHAALRWLNEGLEIKRVIVRSDRRGTGLGRLILASIEDAARELGATTVLLQTGDRQPEAVAMYERAGYRRIPVYDPYRPITNSMCFEKTLTPRASD